MRSFHGCRPTGAAGAAAVLSHHPGPLPIFKEHTMALVDANLNFTLRHQHFKAGHIAILRLSFRSRLFERGALGFQLSSSTLLMHPPGTEMTDRTKT